MTTTLRKITLQNAAREYGCEGCGEWHIPKGTQYGRIFTIEEGRLKMHRLCIRCSLAFKNKMLNATKPFSFEPGCFKPERLNSAFRKAFGEYMDNVLHHREKANSRELLDKLGIDNTKEIEMEKRMKEERKVRVIHREKAELEKLKKKIAKAKAELVAMMGELGTLHLAESVAWVRNDPRALKDAKDSYGMKASEIVAKIEGM